MDTPPNSSAVMRVSACANMLRGNRSKVPPTRSEENFDDDHPESPSLEKRVALGSGRGPNGSPFELGGRNQGSAAAVSHRSAVMGAIFGQAVMIEYIAARQLFQLQVYYAL